MNHKKELLRSLWASLSHRPKGFKTFLADVGSAAEHDSHRHRAFIPERRLSRPTSKMRGLFGIPSRVNIAA